MAVELKHGLAVYRRSIGAQLRSIVEYPADFWVMSASGLFSQTIVVAFLAVLFGSVESIAGWTFHEMLVLVAFMRLSGAFVGLGWDGMWSLGLMVLKGDLDYRITRPAPVSLQVGSAHIALNAFGDAAIAAAMLVYGWIGAGIGLDPAVLAAAALLLATAVILQLALVTTFHCLVFWVKGQTSPFAYAATELESGVGEYPLKIYPAAVKTILTFGLPFAFINYIPVQILTGRLGYAWLLAPPAAAAVCLALAVLIFRAGMRSYESAGH